METVSVGLVIVRIVIAAVVLITFGFVNAIVMGYLERKIAAKIQRRPGPMEVGWQGILQLIVDGFKIISKQLIIPRDVDRRLFRMAPLLSFTPVVLPFIVIPFSEKLQARDINLGLLFIISVSSINVMTILLAGWSSNNKYAMFGAMRSVAQNIAFEIPVLLSLLTIVLMTNTYSMQGIVHAQSKIWFVLVQPLAFLIYFVAGIAETNRAPFDLPEAESELTAGFHTEYSGFGFSLFMMSEYANMFLVCSIATVLFLGGWKGIPLPMGEYTGAIWFLMKVYTLMLVMVWIRWTYPRVRFDQLLNFSWKYLIPFSLVNLLITVVIVKL
ncbi:MAG: NADH-quinone oxidoreductase subunit NuoH [Deltaproteobacteria bacterium]|nr:MAG: NADH-quinone oxidoreductase subunit NuoH [Deltaproteobacteria bacterium]